MSKFLVGSKLFPLALVAIGFWTTSASAVNLIYEPFDYTSGAALLGQTNTSSGTAANGNSWLRTGTNAGLVAPTQINVGSGSLTGPSELKGSIGNDLTMNGNGGTTGPADRLSFVTTSGTQTAAITSGTIYYSFLLRVDDLTGANNTTGDYFFSLNNTANATTPTYPTVIPGQMRARIDPNDGSKYNLGMFTNRTNMTAGDTAWASNSLAVNDTVFVVGAYNVGSGTSNSTRLWINPDPLTFGLPTAPVTDTAHDNTGASNGGTIGSILVHQRTAPFLTIDELRVSTLWKDVTPLGNPTFYWDIDVAGTTAGAGGATPSGTWDSSNTNWNTGPNGDVAKIAWQDGASAVFSAGSDATGTYTINVSGTQLAGTVTFEDSGTVTLTGGTLNLTGALHTITTSAGQTATIESVVGGSVGFIKDGTGTLVLTASETYSGTTSINGGTLQLGNAGTTGTLPTGSAIADNGRLTIDRSNAVTQGADFSGSPITGTGGLTQAGSSTLTLNAANTFSGTTRATAGTISLTNSLALQNSTVDMNTSDTGAVSFDSSLSAVTLGGVTGSRNLSLLNSAGGALAVSIGSNVAGGPAPYTGVLSGSGSSLTKIGTSTQVLSGANTYSGGTTINAGTLQFGKTFAMPAGPAGGDYNGDGKVDAADDVTWRMNPAAHGGTPGGYNTWRSNFGSSGIVTVNSGGTLAVNAGGTDEWTDSTDALTNGTLGSLINGKGGQAGAVVNWMSGSTLAIDTTNAPGAPTAPDLTYTGVVGGFHTAGGGTTDAVGFTKRGLGKLTLPGNNTFSGQLTVVGGTADTDDSTRSILVLNGTNLNAGTTMTIPTVSIGTFSILELGASNILPSGSLINTTGPRARFHLDDGVIQTVRSLSGANGIVEVGNGRLNIVDQAGDNYVFGTPSGAYISSSDGVFDPNRGTIYKTGAGTLTLEGDAGTNFNGTFFMESGTLKLSRGQALGSGGTGRLVVKGGQLGRSDTPTSNFTYTVGFVDLDVFRYDLSDAPAQTSQFSASTITTLKQDNVEMNVTNSGTQTAASGRMNFLGDIRNHDPNPSAGDDASAIRGITKTGNGVLFFQATTTYKGPTTVQDGVMLVNAASTLGDYTQVTIGTLNLKGGTMATTATRTTPIKNPVVVDSGTGTATIAHFSTTNSLSSVVMEFDNSSIVGTSGSLTISNLNSGTGNTVFRPLFTGSGFDFGLPITISASTGTGSNVKSNELEGGNTSGTQTFSGVISGGGSFRRVNAGGTTILSGLDTYTGNTSVDAGTLSITHPYLADTADVSLTTGGILDLSFLGTDTINRLLFDGAAQAVGTWGATGSGATNINDTFFTGTGVLNVTTFPGSGAGLESGSVPEPASIALTFFGMALLATGRRRRRDVGC